MALKDIFLRDTRILISWENTYAKIQLVYNDFAAPIKTVIDHWPEFSALLLYFNDFKSSYAIIAPKDIQEAMARLKKLEETYGQNKKMCFIYSDEIKALTIQNMAPDEFHIHYERRDMSLVRVLPDNVIECDDGWTIWNNYVWNVPALSADEIAGFRRDEIIKDQLVSFLGNELPVYKNAGLHIDCDIDLSQEKAVSLHIVEVARNSITVNVEWSIPLDSIDTDFDMPDYILSDNVIMSGLHPAEIQERFDKIIGKHILSNDSIASFLDDCYIPWKPWITGKTDDFENIHCWLVPPYNTFIRIDLNASTGIGHPNATPYVLIGNECLSGAALTSMLQSKYTHLNNGWVRTSDLYAGLNISITAAPSESMKRIELTADQIIHQGTPDLAQKWDDILPVDDAWVTRENKHVLAAEHIKYLFARNLSGGFCGGYEYFMAYGMNYILDIYSNNPDLNTLVVSDEYVKSSIKKALKEVWQIRTGKITLKTYNQVYSIWPDRKTSYDILILIEPDSNGNKELVNESVYELVKSSRINLIYTTNFSTDISGEQRSWYSKCINVCDVADLQYLIRDINSEVSSPAKQTFHLDLGLKNKDLIYHDKQIF